MRDKKLLLISGPTGTGKTQLAVNLAKKFNGEIISSDSRQVYKGLDYGTNKFFGSIGKWHFDNKKGVWFFETIPVYLYDLVLPNQPFSVFAFVRLANEKIVEIWQRGKLPIIVGGTGFYQQALISPFETLGISTNPKLRRQLEKLSTDKLVTKLKSLNLTKAKTIDLNNRRRIIRAIEVLSHQGKIAKIQKPELDCLWVGLTAPKKILYTKAHLWITKIFKNRLQIETTTLMKRGYKNTPILKGIIYGPTIAYLEGLIEFSNYYQKLYQQLKNYIRRQLTWFKKQPEIIWFDINQKDYRMKLEKLVQTWLNRQ